MNHLKNWLFLDSVDLWVTEFMCSSWVFRIEAIAWNYLRGVMLWNSVESVKGLRESSGVEAVDGWLEVTFLKTSVMKSKGLLTILFSGSFW